ncbi:transport and Golgi organization 2 homolog [Phalaenopsis equestris]|uniref:transport and Golgi organization 2 homolog n=1 Tax=Phalaenopsis equestris TaxID=78828 RepID=UPI0009E60288|nr:transport and Golgi organization 2 homolog [Phalaenopsis equestris]XP_020574224.1 transport and Golgi organization 2 homolog [Phalaenopsis equestris]
MCISAWIWLDHPKYSLLLLSNRDESHDRPTRPVEWWEGDEKILGGRDEVAGGTWMGCTRNGRIAFLTNFREPEPSSTAKSRGYLTLGFLQSHMSPLEYAEDIAKEATEYNGFNLILADIHSKVMVYISNRPVGEPASVQIVSPGLHVLSNAKLDTPWPKALRLHENFNKLLRRYGEEQIPEKEIVLKLMSDDVKADLNRLPDTGCEPEWEFNLSSIFVDTESNKGRYGTRSMVALSVISNGEVSFYERYLDVNDGEWRDHTVEFRMDDVLQKED